MHLVQLLLPLTTNDGKPQPAALFHGIQRELTELHGGLTAYNRAPATGLWQQGETKARDDVVVIEVMVETLDHAWWQRLRDRLEAEFEQQEIVVRAVPIVRL